MELELFIILPNEVLIKYYIHKNIQKSCIALTLYTVDATNDLLQTISLAVTKPVFHSSLSGA